MSGRQYRHFQRIDYLADLVGADIAADLLKIRLEQIDTPVDIEDRPDRDLGKVDIAAGDSTLPVEQQTPVTIEDITAWSAGTLPVEQQTPVQIAADDDAGNRANLQAEELGTALGGTETALITILARAFKSIGAETLQVEQQGVIDVSSRDGRNLGDVDVTALPDNDHAVENATALASGGSISTALAAPGADTLEGRVVRATTSYDVTIEWIDAPGGTVLFTTSVATGVAAGTETLISQAVQSPYMNVVVADAGSGSGAVTATYNLT